MLTEILSQPTVVAQALPAQQARARELAARWGERRFAFILLVARGTSDHAAVFGQYLFQYFNGIPVGLATPSLATLYRAMPRLENTLVIGISQSGQGPDVIEVLRQARERGAFTLAITNDEASPLAQTADFTLPCLAGPERSVAATKTYTTTLTALLALAQVLPSPREELGEGLVALPEQMAQTLETLQPQLAARVERFRYLREAAVLGRGFQYATALEVALKLKETCYVVTAAYSAADFLHGPIAIVEEDFPTLLFAAPGPTLPGMREVARKLRERHSELVVVSRDHELLELATLPLAIPVETLEILTPLLYVLPGQLFACLLAEVKGYNPDEPRGLNKVTKTQ